MDRPTNTAAELLLQHGTDQQFIQAVGYHIAAGLVGVHAVVKQRACCARIASAGGRECGIDIEHVRPGGG